MRRFYSTQPLQPQTDIQLEGQVARHMLQVLRMQPGETCVLFDGQSSYPAELLGGRKDQAQLRLGAALPVLPPSPVQTHLGQAISKGDKMDWVVQKAVELGVTAITPLYTQQGDVRLKPDRELKKWQQWQQIALSACEQCGRDDLPVIHPPQKLADWLVAREEALKLVLHPHLTPAGLPAQPAPASVALLIGPEGGLTEQEVTQAQSAGWSGLRLGPRILRTETAPVAALALVQHLWGDWTN
ncbi:16S rRNA (uracil(1498)-N(3))-methyltransferase [Marinospirillum sp. MEB164]|uniref:Ribosomal RNA small subunit methyltransferase E n=1 Tax=Marinospirillum alkalitolerans TaxID=3123374 RepID=A0ABW8PVN0_9GAMM